ncbi:MAG: polyprenyl synthetase family protein, partial [Microvirga sp.]
MMPSTSSFATRLTEAATEVETFLETLLSDADPSGEIVRPPRLAAAMRHAVLGGGKRLRP